MDIDRHRPLFIVATALAIPLVALLWWFTRSNAYEAVGYPLFAVYLAWVLGALTRRRLSARAAIATSHVVMTVFWLGLMAFRLFLEPGSDPIAAKLTPDVYMVFLVLCVMAHLLFPTRTALQASSGILAATVVVSAAWVLANPAGGASPGEVGRLASYEGILAVALVMLYALARSKDDHARALLETERMRELAYRDTLTHLPNRRNLHETLQRMTARAEGLQHDLSVISFDIDDFKRINDTLGHRVGDRVLEAVHRSVRPLLRDTDTFGRWGGEEFLIVAPHADHPRAMALADRVRRAMAGHRYAHGVGVTASFGVATYAQDMSPQDLLDHADSRLYQAKRAGRNRVVGADAVLGDDGGPGAASE